MIGRTGLAGLALMGPIGNLLAQAANSPPSAEELIARFERLDAAHRTTVVRNIERSLSRDPDEALQRIMGCQRGAAAYDLAGPPQWFDPRDYAPAATPRQLVAAGTETHVAATARMHRFECLPQLHAAVSYDWQLGKPVRREQELSVEQRFANYANGLAPGADQAVAQVLAALDTDPAQRRLGGYFDHLYGDRFGNVFAGVTLFEAWHSGVRIEMPDTDAIAFAQLVLHTQSFLAPLPDNRRRQRLYDKMRDAFALHREHRTLRLAIAATLVAVEPQFDPDYRALIDRGHWLWQKHGLDLARVAAFVASTEDRSEFLRQVDTAIGQEHGLVDQRRRQLAELARRLRNLADEELRSANG